MSEKKKLKLATVIKFLFQFKKKILTLFCLGFISSAFYLASPYLSKLYIDNAFLKKDFVSFKKITILSATIFLLSTLLKAFETIQRNKIKANIGLRLASKLMDKLYSLDLNFLLSKPVGENIYSIAKQAQMVTFVADGIPQFMVVIIRLPILLAISFSINFHLTLAFLILSPMFLMHNFYIQRKLKTMYAETWKLNLLISKKLHEAFSSVLITKVFGLEVFQKNSIIRLLIRQIRLDLKRNRLKIVNSMGSGFSLKIIVAGISVYGGWLIIRGKISLGNYTAAIACLGLLSGSLQSLALHFENFIQEIVTLNKISEVMTLEPEVKDSYGVESLKSIEGNIAFRNVWFGYEEGKAVIKNINFSIPNRQWVGMAGPSGCGKTTIANLILRLFDTWEGQIFLDNTDLKKISLSCLRGKVAIATQQPILLDLSIKDNIAYGLKRITDGEIDAASMLAQAHDFITQLPQGYSTLLGENAFRLSHGLKQKIALARAIIRNPDLLILDEATSSIDSETEEKILKALREKRVGKTTIVISHRLSTIKDADRIYFFRPEGGIAEGTHNELLSENNSYRKFFQNQMEQASGLIIE